MFSRYYQSELLHLRTLGREYAQAHPAVAGLLAERGGDPDVERLLEGVAFLTARIREHLDASVPELAHELCELLVPHYLRPLPSCAIVEFTPTPGALRGRLPVPAGCELKTAPVDGAAPCTFRTSADVALLALSVVDASLDRSAGADPLVRVKLQAAQPALGSIFEPEGIRFFVHGELPLASSLLLALARHVKQVEVRTPSGRSVRLPPGCVRLSGFDRSFPLLPWPALAPQGYRVLQELFSLPQKFLFFEVRELDRARSIAEERFELVFTLERQAELPVGVTADTLRVNCAPVLNLFTGAGEPIRYASLDEEHLVRAAGLSPLEAEVSAVDRVEGTASARGERRAYPAFTSFRFQAAGVRGRFHRLRRRHSPVDGGIDVFLALGAPRGATLDAAEETVTIDLTCTNRGLPLRLRAGDICVPTQTSPTVARFRDIVPPTKPARPPLGSELLWRLLSHLALSRTTLTRLEGLKALVALYDFASFVDEPKGRANQLRIEGLRSVTAEPTVHSSAGYPVRGTRVILELDEAMFAGRGDAFLFGAALEELFASRTPLNATLNVLLRLSPGGREYAFSPRSGDHVLL